MGITVSLEGMGGWIGGGPLPTCMTQQADNQLRVCQFNDVAAEFFLDVAGAQRIQ